MKVKEIAQLIQAEVVGDESLEISSLAGLQEASSGQITFAVDIKRKNQIAQSAAGVVIVPQRIEDEPKTQLVVKSVEKAVAKLLGHFAPQEDKPQVGIHPSADIAPSAGVDPSAAVGANVVIAARTKIGASVIIHPNAVIGSDVAIGAGSVIYPGVVIHHRCEIGKRVVIGSNCVIGFDGFGYYFADGAHHKYPHIGTVVIEDDVEIGACTCVDRAKFSETRIGAGTKIDNLVQIAHNVRMGKGCIMCGQVGIAGSVTLGNYVVAGGSTVFRDGITVGDQVQAAGCAAVVENTPAGEIVAGIPAKPARQVFREVQAIGKLPELLKEFKKLEARIEKLETQDDR